jgi:alanine dehydrogenase
MIIGVPKERKSEENRVSMTPAGVEILAGRGHQVLVETGAGSASGFEDEAYLSHGARVVGSGREVFDQAEMVLRVKEPQAEERGWLKEGQIYFSYLHLAACRDLTQDLIQNRAVAIGYETIQKADGSLPLLTPMSEVAGPMAVQEGAKYLEMAQGGHGLLLGGVPGVDPGTVLIIGGGKVGLSAAKKARGLGAKVYVLDIDLDRLRYLSDVLRNGVFILMSNPATIRDLLPRADLVIGCVLQPGRRTPKVVTAGMLETMKPGSVLVDVSIDQGGCFETSKETTHAQPTYKLQGIVHYAVSNMPGAVPKTSTMALTNATLPYVLQIAGKGWRRAMTENQEISKGANVVLGRVVHPGVAEACGLEPAPVTDWLE